VFRAPPSDHFANRPSSSAAGSYGNTTAGSGFSTSLSRSLGATRWSRGDVVSQGEILEAVGDRYGAVTIETDHHGAGLVVAARGEHPLIPRALSGDERSGTQLSGALRLAAERAAARARARVRDVVSLPPAPVAPVAPALLYVAWLAETLTYALLLR